eukprot:PhF_6_TR22590/c0_g1_i2/m.32222
MGARSPNHQTAPPRKEGGSISDRTASVIIVVIRRSPQLPHSTHYRYHRELCTTNPKFMSRLRTLPHHCPAATTIVIDDNAFCFDRYAKGIYPCDSEDDWGVSEGGLGCCYQGPVYACLKSSSIFFGTLFLILCNLYLSK